MVNRYLEKDSATQIVNEFEKAENTKNRKDGKESGKPKLSILAEFRLYSKELQLVILLGVLVTLPFYRILYSYSTLLMTKDINDLEELKISKIISLISILGQLILTGVMSVYEFNKSRKRRIIFAFAMIFINWACIPISHITGNYWFVKLSYPLTYMAGGGLIVGSMFTISGNMCVPSIVGIGNAVMLLLTFLQNLIFPIFVNENSSKMTFIYVSCAFMTSIVIATIILICAVPETSGLTKSEIFLLLRKNTKNKNTESKTIKRKNSIKRKVTGVIDAVSNSPAALGKKAFFNAINTVINNSPLRKKNDKKKNFVNEFKIEVNSPTKDKDKD